MTEIPIVLLGTFDVQTILVVRVTHLYVLECN